MSRVGGVNSAMPALLPGTRARMCECAGMFPDRVRECSIWHPLVSSMAHPGRPAQPWRNSNRSRLLGITVAAAMIGAAIDGYTASTAPAVAVYAAGGLVAVYLLVRDGERLRSSGRFGRSRRGVGVCSVVSRDPAGRLRHSDRPRAVWTDHLGGTGIRLCSGRPLKRRKPAVGECSGMTP